jgi:hypothetical protein
MVLTGCISAEALRARTDKELASCLQVGMSLEAAEKCTKRADLEFDDREKAPGVRRYVNSAGGNGPMLIAIVHVRLHFSPTGQLQSWDSKSMTDGL